MTKPIHVLKVSSRNVKSVREVTITFDDKFHKVCGNTGQGKTAILEMIRGGIEGLDPSLVTTGENAAEIKIEFNAGTIARFCPGPQAIEAGQKTSFVAHTVDGKKMPQAKAKAFLRMLADASVFNPLEWVRLGSGPAKGKTQRLRQQRDELLEAIPMEITVDYINKAIDDMGLMATWDSIAFQKPAVDYENDHAINICSTMERFVYTERMTRNAERDAAQSAADHLPKPAFNPPSVPLNQLAAIRDDAQKAWALADNSDRMQELNAVRVGELKAKIESFGTLPTRAVLGGMLEGEVNRLKNIKDEIDDAECLLMRLRKDMRDTEGRLREAQDMEGNLSRRERYEEDLKEIEALAPEVQDVEALKKVLDEAEANVHARKDADVLNAALQEIAFKRGESDAMTPLVEFFRDYLPARLLKEADMPVPGLKIEQDLVTINGIPMHNLGTSEQNKVGVLAARTIAPNCGYVLLDQAESMSDEDLAALAEIPDVQYIMAEVNPNAKPGPGVTVMENGEVKA